jgi:hypothetical protein
MAAEVRQGQRVRTKPKNLQTDLKASLFSKQLLNSVLGSGGCSGQLGVQAVSGCVFVSWQFGTSL